MEYVSVRGIDVPALGCGTAPLDGKQCYESVRHALDCDYRHIDTAQMYDNESEVGRAVSDASVPREDIFIVTKVHKRNLAPADLLSSVRRSRERLQVETVDLLLIHAPSRTVPVEESIGTMNRLQS